MQLGTPRKLAEHTRMEPEPLLVHRTCILCHIMDGCWHVLVPSLLLHQQLGHVYVLMPFRLIVLMLHWHQQRARQTLGTNRKHVCSATSGLDAAKHLKFRCFAASGLWRCLLPHPTRSQLLPCIDNSYLCRSHPPADVLGAVSAGNDCYATNAGSQLTHWHEKATVISSAV